MQRVSDLPAQAAKPRFYYGWVIVAVITLSGFVVSFQFNPVISIFMGPITQEFGWSRSAFASAVTVGTFLSGGLALVIGPVEDRFGPKWVLFAGFLAMGALVIGLGQIQRFWQFYLIMVGSRVVVQGVINLSNYVVIAKWFDRLRGRATSYAMIGQNLGNAIMPVLAQVLLAGLGWRSAITAIGLLAWAITLAPIVIWLRREPADMGLQPDGDAQAKDAHGKNTRKPALNSFTLKEALRTTPFYLLLLAFVLNQFICSGLTFSMLPILEDQGLSRGQAVAVLSAWGFVTVPGVLITGFLRDRLSLRKVLVGTFLGMSVGLLVLSQTHNLMMGMLFALVYGLFFSASLLMQALAFADYYGPKSLGAIRGFITPFLMTSNAIAPLAASLFFDFTGSYAPVLVLYIALSTMIWAVMLFAKPPKARTPLLAP